MNQLTPIEIEKQVDDRPDLNEFSLEGLRWLLLHPEEWPKDKRIGDFSFDFSVILEHGYNTPRHTCGTVGCAIGLAQLYWPGLITEDVEAAADEFWFGAHVPVFYTGSSNDDPYRITPEIVAGRIDDLLNGRKVRYMKKGDGIYDGTNWEGGNG